MTKKLSTVLFVFLVICSVCYSQTTAPAGKPANLGTDPQARAILDRLEQAGEKFRTLRADIDYKVVNATLGDSEKREGWVCFRKADMSAKKSQSAFRVHFETLQQGKGPRRASRVDYAYDGQWLSVAKQATKTLTRYQITEKSNSDDSMTLGKGPFPLPFGQKADDMVRFFECSTRQTKKYDPPNTDYIKLIPRKEYSRDFSFTRVQMWIDRKTQLPVKIVSMDTSKNRTTVLFKKVQTSVGLEEKLFRINKPAGWKLIVKRLEEGDKLAP